ncbi:hypothetical protein [Paenibacillus sp. GYB003]|uniref:hypothetical protein n=1 Tax=Paenibacillus sp. GYB003 TaxID=2994392 RepID=UPI002F9625BF
MGFHVIEVESKELQCLNKEDVNDMFYDAAGRVMVTDFEDRTYYLLADKAIVDVDEN